MKIDYNILKAARNSVEDNTGLMYIIAEMSELNRIGTKECLLFLDNICYDRYQNISRCWCDIFDTGMNLATSGCEPALIEAFLYNSVCSAYDKGIDLMKSVLIAAGVLSIVRRDPSRATALLLCSYMGDEFYNEYVKFTESGECRGFIQAVNEGMDGEE